jgi:hypothetical protein
MKSISVRQLFTEIENQTGLIIKTKDVFKTFIPIQVSKTSLIKTTFIFSAIKPKSSLTFVQLYNMNEAKY